MQSEIPRLPPVNSAGFIRQLQDCLTRFYTDIFYLMNEGMITKLKYIIAVDQSEGDLHLSDSDTWAISKANIKMFRVVTDSTQWDLWILHNDNGYAADDADTPKYKVIDDANGNKNIRLDYLYEDEDGSNELHLYFNDKTGSNTASFYVFAKEMQ